MITNEFTISILNLPRWSKLLIVAILDISFCILSLWLAFYLRLGEFISLHGNAMWAIYASILIALPIFVIQGLYRAIFRFSGWPALITVAKAVLIYSILFATIYTAFGVQDVPRTIGIIQPILLLIFVGASRAFASAWLGAKYQGILNINTKPRVLIYGAGQSGRQLSDALANSNEMHMIGFLDDDEILYGHLINGQPIYNPKYLQKLVKELNISTVLLAMHNISRKRRIEIINSMQYAQISVRTLPSVNDLIQGKLSVTNLKELDIDDLLGREAVTPNHILLEKIITNKVVCVTGAGGSIGSELSRQILKLKPSKLLLIEQNEYALYIINQELQDSKLIADVHLIPILGSVQDKDRIIEIFSTWHVDTVYHAAAYKHVPLVEHNLAEGIKNNVLGTMKTAFAAIENGVKDFVLISTDKAVRPTNTMGASKRLSEMILQALNSKHFKERSKTRFSMVRFGNVLGSSGSVVPKFRQQIAEGGPITLTHPEITRFFMSMHEAAQLVIQAGSMAKGGDVFLLEMGEPVKIINLARRMIELSGQSVLDSNNLDGDIEIKITGLRPGEKLFEELLISNNPEPTNHAKIMKANEQYMSWEELEPKIKALEMALNINDVKVIRLMMTELVTGYKPTEEIVDWVYVENCADIINNKNIYL